MPFTHIGGAAIYWKREGLDDGPRLVLLNSIGTDMDLWDAALAALRPHFAILRIDTRGHGASEAPSGDYAMSSLAGDVAAVMTAAGFDDAVIAGVSLGGMIAMQLAVDRPQRVRGLALICTSATMDAQAWSDRIDRVRSGGMAAIADLAMGRFLSPAFVEDRPEIAATIRRGVLDMSSDGYAGCGAAIRDMDLIGRLAAIGQPTLVLTGERDQSTPLIGHGEHILTAIPGARHLALDTAHLAPVEAPAPVAQAIIDTFGKQRTT